MLMNLPRRLIKISPSGVLSFQRNLSFRSAHGSLASCVSWSKNAGIHLRMVRRQCSNGSPVTPPPISHVPPLAVRVGLVATSVGLGTPFFAVGGIVRMWYSYLPRTPTGLMVKWGLSVVGGGSILNLTYSYVIPFLQHHSDFVLPFALSNAIASGIWYLFGEYTFGLPFMSGVVSIEALKATMAGKIILGILRMMGQNLTATTGAGILFQTSLPVGGIFVGGLTALTAPFLWPMAFSLCWDKNMHDLLVGENSLWLVELYEFIAVPVGLPTGIFAGVGLHLFLRSFVNGQPGQPWTMRSLPMLAAISGVNVVYFTWFRPPQGIPIYCTLSQLTFSYSFSFRYFYHFVES